ncbi:MAG: DUF6079 family protein [Pyrinomonadaceae bacterium]
MKRILEKIKDLVDVRSYETVKNFASDTTATVEAYRFTDVTSDLLAKWIDEIVEISHRPMDNPSGMARALAGNRGVGKSHFLAVLGALLANSDLRTHLTDQHVGLSAQRLVRQKYSVVNVERGLGESLTDEFRTALEVTFAAEVNFAESNLGDSAGQMLIGAASLTGDLPLIVIIDSAYDRKARVKRDDGAILGEMAEAARQTRTFLAIALDDDIAGADGVNAAITRTCAIDYLDQEHLYRIVDAFLYQKRPTARLILRELYREFRQNVPGFNWSEPRFVSLYPIHPVVVDITPAVRLYAPKFAFLQFAAENAAKLLARPAHSLLALDEVFDRVEPELRKSGELEETFAVYDELAAGAISQIPIMQRLQAKLVLKGLLLLSLDGRGATARELGAAMLIYEENAPLLAVQKIEEIILLFANSIEQSKIRQTPDNDEMRYSLGNSLVANFEQKLTKAAQDVDSAAINRVWRLGGAARFADWMFGDFGLGNSSNTAELNVNWRGSNRHGRIVWQEGESQPDAIENLENLDWQILIAPPYENNSVSSSPDGTIIWQPAPLRRDEEEVVRRFAALLTDAALTDEFSETAIAAEQTTAAIIERIWTRIFLEDGKLIVGASKQVFSPEAKSSQTLTNALEIALAPFFATRYPAHPNFSQLLTAAEVSQLVNDLFGGANPNAPETQKLAQTFALPLGIVAQRGANYVLETDENLLKQPLVQTILVTMDAADGQTVLLRELSDKLKQAPYGLQREANNLLLAALVARHRLEFVTTNGDRITHRSLDLQIIWTDLTGVAKSSIQPRSSAELANWASQLTGIENLISLDAEREKIVQALSDWFSKWQLTRLLANFDELPDEVLNVRAWRLSSQVGRSFGAAAEAVKSFLEIEISLEDALERVIDAFGDAPEAVTESRLQFAELECFIAAAKLRQTVWRYIARAEATDDPAIEMLRGEILEELNITENSFDTQASREFESTWQEFRHRYTEFYVQQHNAVMHSSARLAALEQIEQSAEYTEFIGLAGLAVAHPHFLKKANYLRAAIKAAKCSLDARQILQTQPSCICGMRLIRAANLEQLPQDLANTIQQGRTTVRRIIAALCVPLATALSEIAAGESNANYAAHAHAFAEALTRGGELPVLTPLDLRLLAQATPKIPVPTMRVRVPRGLGALPLEEMRTSLNLWLDNLPNEPVLVKLLEDDN